MAVIISYHQQSTFISLVVIYKALETKEAYVRVESALKKNAANYYSITFYNCDSIVFFSFKFSLLEGDEFEKKIF